VRSKPDGCHGGRRRRMELKERRGMRALKAIGFSAREIGLLFGRTRATVQEVVGKGWEEWEAKRGKPRPHQYNERWYRGFARKLYQKHHGVELITAQHVHHINHDFTDNRIENLTVLNAGEHSRHHHPANPTPRWLRPERQAYMKKYMETYRGGRRAQQT